MNIIEKRKTWFTISIILILAGLLAMPINAFMGNGILNFDVEFIGGTVMEVNIGQDFDIAKDIKPIVVDITGEENLRLHVRENRA